ncbi:MAG: isopenicillin N synthase family dioxygenase [Steroidobacteraceae bacterium]
MSASIAAVDYRLWKSDPARFATSLGNSFQRYGFAVVDHHSLADSQIEACLQGFKTFFALPESEKLRYRVAGGGGARGYTPFGVEAAKGAELHDLKEFWHVGRELPAGDRYRAYMPDNLWPAGLPGFREDVLALWEAFDQLGRELLSAIAMHLGLPARWFDAATDHGNSILRVIHYPPVAPGAAGVRAGAHEDINAITLLLGAEEAGLQVLDRDGRWLDINPPAGSLVCNIGDMLQRLTNHVLPSTTHRVINPVPERAGHARYSMPFFLHFNPDFEIRSLPGCVSESRPDRYLEPITANDYLQERLREIRLL